MLQKTKCRNARFSTSFLVQPLAFIIYTALKSPSFPLERYAKQGLFNEGIGNRTPSAAWRNLSLTAVCPLFTCLWGIGHLCLHPGYTLKDKSHCPCYYLYRNSHTHISVYIINYLSTYVMCSGCTFATLRCSLRCVFGPEVAIQTTRRASNFGRSSFQICEVYRWTNDTKTRQDSA